LEIFNLRIIPSLARAILLKNILRMILNLFTNSKKSYKLVCVKQKKYDKNNQNFRFNGQMLKIKQKLHEINKQYVNN